MNNTVTFIEKGIFVSHYDSFIFACYFSMHKILLLSHSKFLLTACFWLITSIVVFKYVIAATSHLFSFTELTSLMTSFHVISAFGGWTLKSILEFKHFSGSKLWQISGISVEWGLRGGCAGWGSSNTPCIMVTWDPNPRPSWGQTNRHDWKTTLLNFVGGW